VVKEYTDDAFECSTASKETYHGKMAIGAFGKRSNIDKFLKRKFIKNKSAWLGVKCHYEYEGFPDNQVALHNFNGGYGGLSKTETGVINFCYLASYQSFKQYKDIKNFNNKVVMKNPFLKEFLATAKPVFDSPLTIAQISFEPKMAVENHMLMCGDAAGLIHPLCGNGMAMAIHSAKLASEGVISYFNSPSYSRAVLEKRYKREWDTNFAKRLKMGRQLQAVLLNQSLSKIAMATIAKSSWALQKLITKTHGKPISC